MYDEVWRNAETIEFSPSLIKIPSSIMFIRIRTNREFSNLQLYQNVKNGYILVKNNSKKLYNNCYTTWVSQK